MRWIWCLVILCLPGCDLARSILPGSSDPAPETVAPPAVAPGLEAEPLEPADETQDEVSVAPVQGASTPNALLPPPAGVGSTLGTTVASLGDPGEGGMWLKTPLVQTERPGQLRYQGSVVAVTLQPLDLPVGSGSQISLRAIQALGAPLTELVEVVVEAN